MSSPHGISPQSLVEHALAASMADDCVAIVRDATSANLRWANNTLTTNGVMHGVHVSIVSFVKQAGGVSVGSVSGSATTQAEVDELVARGRRGRARRRARRGRRTSWSPTAPRPTGPTSPASTGIEVYDDVAPALGEAFGRAGAAGRVLYGFVNHEVTTTYLGSTTGLRLRHVQPTGHFALHRQDRGPHQQRLGRPRHPRLQRRRPAGRSRRSWPSGWPGASAGSTSRPAATTRSCRRPRSPT